VNFKIQFKIYRFCKEVGFYTLAVAVTSSLVFGWSTVPGLLVSASLVLLSVSRVLSGMLYTSYKHHAALGEE